MKVFMRLLVLLLVVLFVLPLSACTSTNGSSGAGDEAKAGEANIAKKNPGSTADSPITLRVMDWSDSVKTIREEFHKQFMAKYPNIKIEYTQLTVDQFKNTILTAIQSGRAPDLFPIPSNVKLATAVAEGWFQPLNPYLGEDFLNQFADGTFQNGITSFDGQLYAIPETASLPSSLVFYNKTLLKEAGYDDKNLPRTYTEFRAAAKKITENGKGKYYGIVEGGKQTGRWLMIVRDWSSLAGAGLNSTSPINLADGRTTYNSEPVTGVYSLFKGLADDKSFHPQTMSISAPEARALFGQGQAGFIVQGAWSIGVWNKDNPNLDYGVMAPPVPDTGRKGSIELAGSLPWMGISADSKNPEAAALYLKELYTGDYFQKARVSSGDAFSLIKGINEQYATVPQLKAYYELAHEYGRTVPNPAIRNPKSPGVFEYYKDVHPDLGELLAGTVAGAVTDYTGQLGNYSEQVGKAWTTAIDNAKKAGVQVDEDDFVFPNWKPMADYTPEDYAALK
ncbi:ABC transporter substrate-binding protein [Paenibacillus rhizophilus]|uniref:Sugar ABC transporter substrate-binding protein n=1 Tax=Paenibacillus rhizophilus TaxID=1850366 RepID=A0A3N9Q5I3_9BACL|nr:sugar ABC transporter substrate-binding protein [Paenibacillus rhizophilus]RQW12766.1 sugar ABC transporter substrate-binding protein [Paenibacillus rhizophilus]